MTSIPLVSEPNRSPHASAAQFQYSPNSISVVGRWMLQWNFIFVFSSLGWPKLNQSQRLNGIRSRKYDFLCLCRTAFIQRGDIQTATMKSEKRNRVVNEIIGALTPEWERENSPFHGCIHRWKLNIHNNSTLVSDMMLNVINNFINYK